MVLRPEHLVDGGARPRLLLGDHLRQRAKAGDAHDLDVAVGPCQFLPEHRFVGAAALAGFVDQIPELLLEAHVLGGGVASAFVTERRHGDAPTVVQAADDIGERSPSFGEEGLGEVGAAGDLLDGPQLDAVGSAVFLLHR